MALLEYDYIIIGGGLSGLQLANAFIKDPYFNTKHIAVIDPELKNTNDKTWSFWEKGEGNWDHILTATWKSTFFYGLDSVTKITLAPYTYKTIRSIDFYKEVQKSIEMSPNVEIIQDRIVSLKEQSQVKVFGEQSEYVAKHVFDSRIPSEFYTNNNATTLLQHFKGWVIETEKPLFSESSFTTMDFSIPYKNTTSFIYILPFSSTKALIEYTFFSPETVTDDVYEEQLSLYIKNYLNIKHYSIVDVEKGIIPMTDYSFKKHNTKNVTKIGTGGGWVKASTGYSFKSTERKVATILNNIKQQKSITHDVYKPKFEWYDRIFLHLLYHHNWYGPKLFEDFYTKNSIEDGLTFLDEQSGIMTDLKIMWRLKSMKFVRAFFQTLFP